MGANQYATAALIAFVSMGLGSALLIAGEGVAFLETLGVVTIVLGWFVVVPLYLYLSAYWSDEEEAERTRADEDEDPTSILKRRYASGEISEAEFERRLDRLLETDERGRSSAPDGEWDRELEYE